MAENKKQLIPIRYIVALLGHCGILVAYTMRVNLSVALVAMVNSTYVQERSHHTIDPECQKSGTNSTTSLQDGEFEWDEQLQGTILGSFFYGYMVTQLPGGLLATLFGGKWVFGIGILITSLLTIVTPFAARLNVNLFIALRVAEGIGEGVTFPAVHAILGRWSPVYERSKLATLVYSGSSLGTLLGYPIAGVLCDSNFLGGWPSAFYVFGVLGIIWFIFWCLFVSSSPETHPMISTEERHYIIAHRGGNSFRESDRPPWIKIFTSLPVWAIVVAHTCHNWTFYTFLTCLPSYFKEVLNFPIKENGFLSALPYLAAFICSLIVGQFADFLRYRGILSTGKVRKLMTVSGLFIPSGLLIVMSYMGCGQVIIAVALVTTAIGILGFNVAGFLINHLDVAPKYAGILQGITNTVATVPGFLGPAVVGILTENKPTREQWQKVFFISSGIATFGGIIFLIFASGNEQTWCKRPILIDDEKENNDDDNRPLVQ
ncbi:sialin-like [Rhopilema esculentum]|uniref:sialin-like n=1 Tax=Rhopilema esculentum TaxID=499914 RepID=UPI0031DE0BC6|eukprot:gene8154-14082_t